MSISPSQKIGIETPSRATIIAPTSIHVDRCRAEVMPSPMPSASVTAKAATANCRRRRRSILNLAQHGVVVAQRPAEVAAHKPSPGS